MRSITVARVVQAAAFGVACLCVTDDARAQTSFFEMIFGGGQPTAQSKPAPRVMETIRVRPGTASDEDDGRSSSRSGGATYRTICVRACDGFFFPISFATTRSNFSADQQKCQASCKDAQLFVYRNPGESVENAEDLSGRPYTRIPNAFKFRKVSVEHCGCRPAPWTEAELQRHHGYAVAEAQAAGKPLPEPSAAVSASAALAEPANPLAVAATRGATGGDATGHPKSEADASGNDAQPLTAKPAEKKPRVIQRTAGAKEVRTGVSSTVAARQTSGSSANNGGFGLFSMGLGAQPKYVWPGDTPHRR